MNIPYMIFIQACAAGIICAIIFVARLIITHVFNGRKQWSNRPYWWIATLFVVIVVAKLVGASVGNEMAQWDNGTHKVQQNAAALVDYDVLYDYCVKNFGIKESEFIKRAVGVDFCDCVATESVKRIKANNAITTNAMVENIKAATGFCETKIDRIMTKKG